MPSRSWAYWAITLGFALGGFFDGILLHQILQWHHLLSLVPNVDNIRAQVLWDGYFHAAMYLLAIIGLAGLWRTRLQEPEGSDWRLAGAVLIGFGIWHIVDAVLSHWFLGIHRIKLDSPRPMLWDLMWLTAFGLVPLVAGWLLLRRRAPRAGVRGSTLAIILLGVLTSGMAAWSLRPPPGQPFTIVVFAPGVPPAQVMNAVVAAEGRLVWSDPGMAVVVLDVPGGQRLGFYRSGALFVGGSGPVNGCFNWSRAAASG